MRHLIKHGLVALSLATLVGCGSDKPAQDPSATSTPPPTPMPESKPATMDPKPIDTALGNGPNAGETATTATTAKPAEKKLTDAEIVAVTSTVNSGEVEMAELAKKTATTPEVKSFATMMITQHRDMETKSKALATKAKITPADNDAATALKADVQVTMTTLKTQKGKDFDKAYMEAQVKAHRDVLDVIDNKLLPNAQNSELKSQLNDTRTHVATHLAKAQEIQTKLDATGTGAKPTTPQKPMAPKK